MGQPSQQDEAISIRRLYFGIQRGRLYVVDIAEFRSGRSKRRSEPHHTVQITLTSKTGRSHKSVKISVTLVYD